MIQCNRKRNAIYFAGIFTTIHLLSVFGMTFFNIALMMAALTGLLKNGKHMKIDAFFLISIMACIITTIISTVDNSLGSEFRNAAIKGGGLYCFVLTLYLIMNTSYGNAVSLLKGFDISCKITLLWCVLQLGMYYIFHVDINTLVFNNLFGVNNARGDYFNGALIPSGFYCHRAVLIPCFVYLAFSATNPYLLVLMVIVTCLTRSTALIMGIVFSLFLRGLILSVKRFSKRKIKRENLISALTILLLAILAMFIFRKKIDNLVTYIIMRIMDSSSNKADNSSVVHFLYYKNLNAILKNLNLFRLFFGTGFGTSGQHYTWFNGQYSDMGAWVVESDFINILLNQGIVGLGLWFYLMYKIVNISIKHKYWENVAFVLAVMVVGIMYNIQFMWFTVVEYSILVLAKHKISVFDVKGKIKKRCDL